MRSKRRGVGENSSESRTFTRVSLAEALYRRTGLPRNASAAFVEMMLSEVIEALGRDQVVKLPSFGSFVVRLGAERVGRNPLTGIVVPIAPRRVVVFKPSSILKARLNGRLRP